MSDLDSAKLKFEEALNRLEKAIRQLSREKPQLHEKYISTSSDLEKDQKLKSLELERDELMGKLELSEKEYDSLEEVANKVSSRLDETISRLERLIKSENESS